VVDANIIIAGIIRDSTTRRLLTDPRLELIAPAALMEECGKYAHDDEVQRKAGMSGEQLMSLLNTFFNRIEFFPPSSYAEQFLQAAKLAVHHEDTSYIAVALKNNSPIWTNDLDMSRQNKVEIVSTSKLVELLE